ncbi:MAG: LysR family transcriptional regulator [Burkholderiaceae bacterium]|nr:MAG: LysR family transcriptional regulator [Burkholderiaceae bacterium]TAM07059.1 MAG: LysR family transcriptional regulator [Pusillimonas sp.]
MDLRLLEYMLRIAELGSINKAAADLHLSQPTLSRHIAALEREMGTKLFIRAQSGVTLTEPGKLLAGRARPLLRQHAILKEQVGEMAAGQLSIGVPPSWQRVFTSPFARTLVAQYPEIKLRVYEGVSNILRDHLLTGILDLCVIPFDSSPPTGFHQTALIREPLILMGSAARKLHPNQSIPLSYLDGENLVLPGRPNVLSSHIEHMLKRKGMVFKVAVETDTLGLCLDLAREGIGYTVMPACTLHDHAYITDTMSWTPIQGLFVTWALNESLARSHSHAVHEGRKVVLKTLAGTLESNVWFGAEAMSGLSSKGDHAVLDRT